MTKPRNVAIQCTECEGTGRVSRGTWLSYREVDCPSCESAGIVLVTQERAEELAYIAGGSA